MCISISQFTCGYEMYFNIKYCALWIDGIHPLTSVQITIQEPIYIISYTQIINTYLEIVHCLEYYNLVLCSEISYWLAVRIHWLDFNKLYINWWTVIPVFVRNRVECSSNSVRSSAGTISISTKCATDDANGCYANSWMLQLIDSQHGTARKLEWWI